MKSSFCLLVKLNILFIVALIATLLSGFFVDAYGQKRTGGSAL